MLCFANSEDFAYGLMIQLIDDKLAQDLAAIDAEIAAVDAALEAELAAIDAEYQDSEENVQETTQPAQEQQDQAIDPVATAHQVARQIVIISKWRAQHDAKQIAQASDIKAAASCNAVARAVACVLASIVSTDLDTSSKWIALASKVICMFDSESVYSKALKVAKELHNHRFYDETQRRAIISYQSIAVHAIDEDTKEIGNSESNEWNRNDDASQRAWYRGEYSGYGRNV